MAVLTASGCFFAAGCESGAVVESGRDAVEQEPEELVVSLTVDDEFADLGAALGWTEGVPDAEVRLHRVTTPIDEWITVRTDSAGVARFENPLPGYYRIVATREAEHGGVLRAFAGGRMHRFMTPGAVTLALRADIVGGLVISEWCCPDTGNLVQYRHHQYLKIYNNSDQTIHLDGLILGRGFFLISNLPFPTFQCSPTEPFRLDPDGVWFYGAYRFPGAGGSFPIGPGEEKLIATDAIDHRPFSTFGMDLRDADFETIGSADVDNPAVPDMPELGPRPEPRGHGLFTHPPEVLFLARDADLAMLPRRELCGAASCGDYARMPKDHVIDVVALWDEGDSDDIAEPCNPPIEPQWDQMPGGFLRCCQLGELELSAQRRSLRTENGRTILMDTNVSAIDFVKAPRTVN